MRHGAVLVRPQLPSSRTILQLEPVASWSRGLAKRAIESDGIFFGAGMTAIQGAEDRTSRPATVKAVTAPLPLPARGRLFGLTQGLTRSNTLKGRVCSQTGFWRRSRIPDPATQHSPQGKPVASLRPVRSRTTGPAISKRRRPGQRNGSHRRSGSDGPWPKKSAMCSAHSGAGQIFLDEWVDAIG